MVGKLSTARKKLQDYTGELEYMKGNLEQLVEERTSELAEAYEEASRAGKMAAEARDQAITANRTKSQFLSNMSHEIRTPMNAILGYTQILLRDKALTRNQQDGIVTIQKSGNNLLDIINDILDMSKIEAGRMDLKPVDFNLSELIHDLAMMFKMRCEQRGLKWETQGIIADEELFLHGDEGKIRQVLINLLGNAVKFTDGGSVLLNCRKQEGKRFLFEVEDTGAGIPENALDTIFDPFRQEEQGLEKGGTGLGLAISNKQVALMGGELKVESQLGLGSRFFFTLKLPPAVEEVRQSRKESRTVIGLSPDSRVKALVVDDHQLNREILTKMLKDIHAEVSEAEDGVIALKMIKEDPPQIVFIDFRMPNMNGVEAIKHIRDEYEDQIKIVLVTATAYDHEFDALKSSGCDQLIKKPFLFERICQALKELLAVTFIYDDETATTETHEAVVGEKRDFSNVKLPQELYQRLKESAELSLITEVKKAVREIDDLGPEMSNLVKALQDMLGSYETDNLVEFLENHFE
ncbi:MAG: response regulator, partial [Proteobacteria bacterium]|nr:response regulator [Pseudomonadota bacterium]